VLLIVDLSGTGAVGCLYNEVSPFVFWECLVSYTSLRTRCMETVRARKQHKIEKKVK